MLATTAAPSALASVSALPESAVPRHPVATVETSAGDRVLYALQPKQWKCFNLTPLARDTVQWALGRDGLSAVRIEAVRANGSSPLWVV